MNDQDKRTYTVHIPNDDSDENNDFNIIANHFTTVSRRDVGLYGTKKIKMWLFMGHWSNMLIEIALDKAVSNLDSMDSIKHIFNYANVILKHCYYNGISTVKEYKNRSAIKRKRNYDFDIDNVKNFIRHCGDNDLLDEIMSLADVQRQKNYEKGDK